MKIAKKNEYVFKNDLSNIYLMVKPHDIIH